MSDDKILEDYPFGEEPEEAMDEIVIPDEPAKPVEAKAEAKLEEAKAPAAKKSKAEEKPPKPKKVDPEPAPPPISILETAFGMLDKSIVNKLIAGKVDDLDRLAEKTFREIRDAYGLTNDQTAEVEVVLLSLGRSMPKEKSPGMPKLSNAAAAARHDRMLSLRGSR